MYNDPCSVIPYFGLTFANMLQMYHNFIKPHMSLNGKTPAEVAGIDMDLGENKLAGLSDKCNDQRPDYAVALGRLVLYIDVINDGDPIRIIPKTWMSKKSWHGVDNILMNHGFSQVSFNRPEGCWVPGLNSLPLKSHAYFLDIPYRQVSDSARIVFLHVLGEDPESTPSSQSHENTRQLPGANFCALLLDLDGFPLSEPWSWLYMMHKF